MKGRKEKRIQEKQVVSKTIKTTKQGKRKAKVVDDKFSQSIFLHEFDDHIQCILNSHSFH